MRKGKLIAILLTFAVLLSLAACSETAPSTSSSADTFTPVTWKFGNQHNAQQIATVIDEELAEEIEVATEGRVKIEL